MVKIEINDDVWNSFARSYGLDSVKNRDLLTRMLMDQINEESQDKLGPKDDARPADADDSRRLWLFFKDEKVLRIWLGPEWPAMSVEQKAGGVNRIEGWKAQKGSSLALFDYVLFKKVDGKWDYEPKDWKR